MRPRYQSNDWLVTSLVLLAFLIFVQQSIRYKLKVHSLLELCSCMSVSWLCPRQFRILPLYITCLFYLLFRLHTLLILFQWLLISLQPWLVDSNKVLRIVTVETGGITNWKVVDWKKIGIHWKNMEGHEWSREIMKTGRIFSLCDLSSCMVLKCLKTFEDLSFRSVSAQTLV